MPSFLMLTHAVSVRLSIAELFAPQRFSVFSPSVSRITTLSTSFAAAVPSVSGAPVESACHAHARPIVTLVVPSVHDPWLGGRHLMRYRRRPRLRKRKGRPFGVGHSSSPKRGKIFGPRQGFRSGETLA